MKIENAVVTEIECENKEIQQDLWNYIHQDKGGDRVGEFAFGINPAVNELIGVMLQDEKSHKTMHIAIGSGYPKKTGSGHSCATHVDCVFRDPTVHVDGKLIKNKGVFVF